MHSASPTSWLLLFRAGRRSFVRFIASARHAGGRGARPEEGRAKRANSSSLDGNIHSATSPSIFGAFRSRISRSLAITHGQGGASINALSGLAAAEQVVARGGRSPAIESRNILLGAGERVFYSIMIGKSALAKALIWS
jgi:hypothetical protein